MCLPHGAGAGLPRLQIGLYYRWNWGWKRTEIQISVLD